jgi:hypothetical protein
VCTIKSAYNTINLADLKLMIIKGPFGIIADFYDSKYSPNNQICMLLSSGLDNADAKVSLGFIMYSTNTLKYMQGANSVSSGYTLKKRSTSAKTGLITYMPEQSDVVLENVRICDGAIISSPTLFEVNDQVWCTIRINNDYVGLALRIA